jgi:hypothetical protein
MFVWKVSADGFGLRAKPAAAGAGETIASV